MSKSQPELIDGVRHIIGALDRSEQKALSDAIADVVAAAPYYVPTMPNSGKPLSVQMTNCGSLGWLTDKAGGYRYEPTHPETGDPWPPMPNRLLKLWDTYLPGAPPPEACLINWYKPDAKLGMHCDADEVDQVTPVLSISLGDDAWFRVGGLKRRDPSRRIRLSSGDVIILGDDAVDAMVGAARFTAENNHISR